MLAKFDEIDDIRGRIERLVTPKYKPTEADLEDTIFDYLLYCMTFGMGYANEQLKSNKKISVDKVEEIIDKKVAGENWRDRLHRYYSEDDFRTFPNLLDTEGRRVFNETAFETAKINGATFKTWQTMEDIRVRDTHDFLQGVTIPIMDRFYTFDGDNALTPFGFSKAENNCNCRCYLEFKKEG